MYRSRMNTVAPTFRRASLGSVREAVSTSGGKLVYRCRIIQAGLNLSGDAYYPAEVIERDIATALPVGTHSQWNHPTWTEEWERPEGNARNLAAKMVSEAVWDATSQAAYADFEFNEEDRVYVEQFHDVLGMSIYVMCESLVGTIGDFTGDVISKMVSYPLNRVDVVTVAGAGGAILTRVSEGLRLLSAKGTAAPAVESADTSAPTTKPEGSSMTPEEIQALVKEAATAAVTAYQESLTAAATANAGEDDKAASLELIAESGLPKAARTVAYEAVRAGAKAEDVIAEQKAFVESLRAELVASNAPAAPANAREGFTAAPAAAQAPATTTEDHEAAWIARREARKVRS